MRPARGLRGDPSGPPRADLGVPWENPQGAPGDPLRAPLGTPTPRKEVPRGPLGPLWGTGGGPGGGPRHREKVAHFRAFKVPPFFGTPGAPGGPLLAPGAPRGGGQGSQKGPQ